MSTIPACKPLNALILLLNWNLNEAPVEYITNRSADGVEHPIVQIQHAQPGKQLDNFDQRTKYGIFQRRA